jgi:hypothetical protein
MGGPDGMEAYRPEYVAAVFKLLSCFFSDILTEKYPRFSNKRGWNFCVHAIVRLNSLRRGRSEF